MSWKVSGSSSKNFNQVLGFVSLTVSKILTKCSCNSVFVTFQ